MATASPVTRKAEAKMQVATGEVALVAERWSDSVDILKCGEFHHLQLSFLPVTGQARAGFPDHWGPRRFERLGSLFFMPAGQWVRAKSDCRVQRSIACRLDPAALSGWFGREPEWTTNHLAGSLDMASAPIRHLLGKVAAELRQPDFGSDAMVELLMAEIGIELSRYFRQVEERSVGGGLAPWRLRLIDECLAGATGTVSLSELARLCSLSVRHLTRAFHKSRGQSLGAYIAEHRLEQARRMLAAGHSVKETAHAAGFSAPTNFATAFRRATGESPRDYRRCRMT